jgi:predicted Zn-dependent protease
MKNIFVLMGLCCVLINYSCNKVPITNRRQMNAIPESQLMSMSLTSYNDFITKSKVVPAGPDAEMVKRVGDRISKAVTVFLAKKNNSKRIAGYKWEYKLVNDKTPNAWCMPGGKIVVYSGLLPISKNEDGLAVVMGHEVAHAIARHGNERMSQQIALQLGGIGISVALSSQPAQTQNIFNQAYGIGATVGLMLPFSRMHESEADEIGLIFAGLAGYNAHEGVALWQRMKAMGGAKPPEFLSTHPSDDSRIAHIQKLLPKVDAYVRAFGVMGK